VSRGPVRAAIVDYGAGNLVSIRNALVACGAEADVVRTPAGLEDADVIVVPGVGASAPAMRRLQRLGLVRPLRRALDDRRWFLGVCLGLQLLFDRSAEDGARMLGLLAGDVVPIPDAPRLPHIGWNQLEWVRPHPLAAGLPPVPTAYFVHSYAPAPADPEVVVAMTEHGGRFASVVAAGRLIGFQPHPERSGADGLRLLANALGLVAADRGRGAAPRVAAVG
jgi:glutamine amidotransferase